MRITFGKVITPSPGASMLSKNLPQPPTFQDQTETEKNGNCFEACLASLFSVELASLPDFKKNGPQNFMGEVEKWLEPRGFAILSLDFAKDPAMCRRLVSRSKGYLIVSGLRHNGELHAVLYQDGKMVHDPHPEKTGIEGPEMIDVIYPLWPAAANQG